MDYEALTEGLPADYCYDGEHYGCLKRYHRPRRAYQCKPLANVVAANVLLNVLCNAHLRSEPSIATDGYAVEP